MSKLIIDITNTPWGKKIRKDKKHIKMLFSTEAAMRKIKKNQEKDTDKDIDKQTLATFTEAMRAINASRNHV